MQNLFLSGLSIAYMVAGIICTIAYYPTIIDLYAHNKSSANISTYFLWTISAFICVLYSIYILDDSLFRIISVLNLLACSIVLILSVRLKNKQLTIKTEILTADKS